MSDFSSLRSKDEEKARADALHARSRELEHQLRDTRALNGQLNREIVQLRSKVHDLESGEYGLPEAEQKITELEEQLERQIEQITSINFALSRRFFRCTCHSHLSLRFASSFYRIHSSKY